MLVLPYKDKQTNKQKTTPPHQNPPPQTNQPNQKAKQNKRFVVSEVSVLLSQIACSGGDLVTLLSGSSSSPVDALMWERTDILTMALSWRLCEWAHLGCRSYMIGTWQDFKTSDDSSSGGLWTATSLATPSQNHSVKLPPNFWPIEIVSCFKTLKNFVPQQ